MTTDLALAPIDAFRAECLELLRHPLNAYRFRGLGPLSPVASLEQALNDSALSAAIIHTGEIGFLGFAQVALVNYRHGTAQLMAALAPEHQGAGWPLFGVRDFILEAFRTLPLRKLCLEVNGPNVKRFGAGLEHFFRHEGTLRRHEWHRGELVDVSFYALFRDDLTGPLWESRATATSATRATDQSGTVQSIVEGVLGCEISTLPPDANLVDSGLLDSLDLVQIIHEISVLLDRDIPREVIAECAIPRGLEHWIGVFEGQRFPHAQTNGPSRA